MWVVGLLALGLLTIAAAACGGGDPEPTPVPPTATPAPTPTAAAAATPEPQPETIVDIAVADDRFQTLVAALTAADLAETLAGPGPFTVFAPTDDAFAKLPEGTIDALLADIPALTEILLYHVVSGNVVAADVVTLDSATTLQGNDVSISVDGDTVRINDARVVITDIEAANGTIHVIDSVLLPPQEVGTIVDIAADDGRLQALVAALEVAGLVDTLMGPGPFTVFAPTDDAFAGLPEGTIDALLGNIPALTEILLYHVVPGNVSAADVSRLDSATTLQGDDVSVSVDGDTVRINDARVVIADIQAANGTIHVIDSVLLPPQEMPQEVGSIVDIAVADGRFQTLVAALTAADLAGTLSGDGPFTVFAPTDDAFAKLPAGTVEALLGDISALTAVLLYHVVSGNVMAADVVRLDSATTLQGGDVSINVDGDTVRINDARVVIADIQAANGTIHVIDSVLLPPQEVGSIVDIAAGDGRFQTLVAALQAAGLAATLAGDGPFTVFAPTDDAFAKLPAGTVEALLGDIAALTDILLYHVVSGNVMAATVVTLDSATTLQGDDVSINVDGDTVLINDARVVIADIQAANGTIHVIDSVLLPRQEIGSIVDIAAGDGRFQTLIAALQAAGLADTLSGEGPFTVFAPTDDAFAGLPAGTVEALLGDIPALTDILLYHVVSGNVMATDVVTLDSATTLQGGDLSVSVDGGTVHINDARVVIADIQAANGTIHVIDSVLLPLQEVGSIVDIAAGDGRFQTLIAALQAAGLADTLSGEGPFTVFAPIDDAFAKLPAGTVETLLEDIPALTEILLYHVVSGNVMAADVVTLDSATTLQGGDVSISVNGGVVSINDARVVIADIQADNGTIHVIDSVLVPSGP